MPAKKCIPAKSSEKSAEGTKKRKRSHNSNKFATYIYKVLKQTHPSMGASKKAMMVLESMTQENFHRIVAEAGKLARANKKETITSREIQTAVRLLFPGELAKHAVSEGTKAVTKFKAA